jgi:hypothetical protein
MKLRFKFFDKPSAPNAPPSLVAYPTGDFEELEQARQVALADADTPTIMAHSVIIEFIDDPSVSERWVRDGTGWTSIDA